ncbi:MAG: hypothetical protein COT73_10270 [Bdellovibrio sp. CG10_big_fil_rev_8_21_14_0_10_47_8]|nr:MAG: hypothetical protein COT73_10270 [Bdellovibrio sp. CG10_big_fil_rev_8_21_14_0_10_47_8]
MLFSCKISSAVLTYLERQGEDLSPLLECTELPEEFVRDPSYWMKAADMETFLLQVLRLSRDEDLILQKIGHMAPTLYSWGVLDSVLRMMPKPQEIFAQPQRFLSYFISPEPPLESLVKTKDSVAFDLPVSTELYPLVTAYLRAAFESLPVYVGQPLAQCTWNDIHFSLHWASEQATMFQEDPGHQISPELLRSVVAELEKHQKDLEQKNRDLQQHNEQLLSTQKNLENRVHGQARSETSSEATLPQEISAVFDQPVHRLEFIHESSIESLRQNLSKLTDYMVRAQQLITLIVGQDRMKPGVKEAMRRTDWERVKNQFPATVEESRQILEKTKKQNEESIHV